jgi:2-polyprenyl-3-methyl-5-hydroxy-6-metoxy-1,4-benzoquinol methylase
MDEYKDYGWSTSEYTCAHELFMKPITRMLPIDGSPILDVGCGNGSFANFLLKNGYQVYGTDASIKGIEIANTINPGRFFIQDLSSDKLPKELAQIKFKTIISTEVIEHLYDPRKYISFCKDILKNSGGGNLIISTPYNGYIKNLAIALLNGYDKHHTVLWDGGHIKFWSYNTIKALLKEFDIEIVRFEGAGRFPGLWKTMIINAEII